MIDYRRFAPPLLDLKTEFMITWIILACLVVLAVVLNLAQRKREQVRTDAGRQELLELRAMGDIVPASIHPYIDPIRCIGSGACVYACPEKSVLTVVNGRGVLTNPLGCIGHGACASACPVQAISLVFGTAKRGLELPQLDPDFQTNQPGVYIVGELGGMGLIRNAVSQGRQAADHIVKGERRGDGDSLDAVVIGAGPAGISATLRLVEEGLNVTLLEREAFGGTITHYPRGKVVMTGPLDFPMYGRVSKRKMSKEELVELWNDIHAKTQIPVKTGALVERIESTANETWTVRSSAGDFRSANVLLALGRRGSPRKLEVPGEDLQKVSYRVIEPEVFRGQEVMVVGGGNAAVESVFALLDQGECASVSISYRKATFARCRKQNRQRIDDEIRSGRVRAHLSTQVDSITEKELVLRDSAGQRLVIPNDSVVVQVGGTAPTALLQDIGIEIVTKYGEA
jgi:thioredoxin reductase/NAD-dependent dihydropyrimidine dehydrogenase PreA subunit